MKILIADDNYLFREAVISVATNAFPEAIITQTQSVLSCIEFMRNGKNFDMIIIDFDLSLIFTERFLNSLLRAAEQTKIVIISSSRDNSKIRKLFALGIKGFIPKSSDAIITGTALQLVANGGKYLPDSLLERSSLINATAADTDTFPLAKPLTNRQSQVLDLVAQGKSNKQIAYDMGVSEATVKLHINALLRSLHVTNRTQAVITAQKMGLI